MSVLAIVASANGKIKKAGFESVSYAKNTADKVGGTVSALVFGAADASELSALGQYGAAQVLHVEQNDVLAMLDAIKAAAEKTQSKTIIFPFDAFGKSLASRLSARLQAGLVSGAIAYPEGNAEKLIVKKNVFSGKAIAHVELATEYKIISFSPNSTGLVEAPTTAQVETFAPAMSTSKIKLVEEKVQEGEIALPEAELVVSAGRGLKGPENWGMIEELAKELGAATACSRPVSDIGWRPHHEHVGQTGITVRPNLYIAIGISGAIQHLAGVNQSKVIVVINKDAEAPFFKAADYGIVGDAFEVVPRLIESVKKLKAGQL